MKICAKKDENKSTSIIINNYDVLLPWICYTHLVNKDSITYPWQISRNV